MDTPLLIILTIIGVAIALLRTSIGNFIYPRKEETFRESYWLGDAEESSVAVKRKLVINITVLDVIYLLVMLVGILAKEVWDTINEEGSVKIRWPRIIMALIVSPIVYVSVYTQFTQDELSLPGIGIAFQNGFFWQAVFSTAQSGSQVI
jgi:hypothetical protein